MYQVLIADDNPLIRMGLANMIPWEELGLTLAGSVDNGSDGICKWKECQPDIVLTDIRMPGMDGLCFMDYIRKHDDNTQIIVVSAYDEFDYAKEAMHYGSLDYLLKPIDKKELIAVLQRAVAKLDEVRGTVQLNKDYLGIFAFPAHAEKALATDSCENNMFFYLTAGKPEQLLDNLEATLQVCDESETALLLENRDRILSYLGRLSAMAPENADALSSFSSRLQGQDTHQEFKSRQELKKELLQLFLSVCESRYLQAESTRGLAFRIKNVIDHNYRMDLSLSFLAEQFNYSTVYISRIFKQEMGCTISRYLTKVRLEKAYGMIQHTNLKLMDIATQIGFSDYTYFYKQFRKRFGQSPESVRRCETENK